MGDQNQQDSDPQQQQNNPQRQTPGQQNQQNQQGGEGGQGGLGQEDDGEGLGTGIDTGDIQPGRTQQTDGGPN